ncbi:ATP-binding protein [Spongiimicrobium salis]|uniref:ATP-binding protein n=1 Tax=Spongiimicrobium salis TaxID=1667022 RepID=UPI00374CDA11
MKRTRAAISPRKMKAKKIERIPLTGEFKKLLGSPEPRGSWFLYGDSGDGKSTFLMQLAKELSKWYKVDYNSMEEKDRGSMTDLLDEYRMYECRKGSFMLLPRYKREDLYERLHRPRSAKVIIIDSLQYFDLNRSQYEQLEEDFPDKLFIWNSHADGKRPKGAVADFIRYNSDIKMFAKGFKVTSKSRMSRGRVTDDYIVWEEGARRYWSKI